MTAERRTENLQNVPMSVIAITAPQLQVQGITSGQALQAMVPNVAVGSNDPTNVTTTVTIRGIPEVGLYVDGIWQPDVGFREADLVQVQRVEILRGPQGTLFGRNTNGGAINYITVPPADRFHIHGSFDFGSYDRRNVDASVDIPLTPTVLTKWTASIHHQGGWLHSVTNQKWYGGGDDKNFRGDLLWKPTQDFNLRLTANQSDYVGNPPRVTDFTHVNQNTINTGWTTIYNVAMMNPAYGPYNFWTGSTEWLSRFNQIGGQWTPKYDSWNYPGGRVGKWETVDNAPLDSDHIVESEYTATLHWNISPRFNITNLASYITQNTAHYTNFFSGPIVGISDMRRWRYDYWTEELHLTGNLFNNKLDYLLGGYWLYTRQRDREYRWGATEFFLPSNPTNPVMSAGNKNVFDPTLASFINAWIANNASSPLVTDIMNNFGLWHGGFSFHDFALGAQPSGPTDTNNMLTDDTVNDYSFFANGTWHVLSNFSLQGGVRLAWQGGTNKWEMPLGAYRTFLPPTLGGGLGYGPGPLFQGGQTVLEQHPYTPGVIVTPMATATYHFTPDDMIYARYAQGYTAGSVSYNSELGRNITLQPEVVKDYELGVRSEWFDRHLQANVTGYYMDWDGRPVQTSYFDPTTGNFIFVSSSGGKSRADGFEFNLDALPFRGLQINFSGAYLTTKWITFGAANVGPNTPWAYAPDWTFHLGAQYDFLLPNTSDLTLRMDYGYVGQYQLNQEIQRQVPGGQPSYGLLNARIIYTPPDGHWNVQLYGTNLTDESYISAGYDDASTWGVAFSVLGQRRMLGIRVGYDY